MLTSLSRMAVRVIRPSVWVVIATILAVPPLVRATQHLEGSAASSPIRLNRGFDFPKSKCQVTPPVGLPAQWLQRVQPETASVTGRTPIFDESIPDSPPDSRPDLLRGPPLTLVS